jgi:integrase
LASSQHAKADAAGALCKRGWHATTGTAPKRGKGSATVEPIRERRHIAAIKGELAHSPRDFALFVVGIHVGLRGSDLLALRWRDVLAQDGSILKKIEVTESKTRKRRIMALQDNASDALARWRVQCGDPRPDQYVFSNPAGAPLTIQRLHQLVNQWARSAGIAGHFGTHTLRKTYGLHLRKSGVGIETLMKVFGHSSQSITLRYIGIEQQEIDDAALKLNL